MRVAMVLGRNPSSKPPHSGGLWRPTYAARACNVRTLHSLDFSHQLLYQLPQRSSRKAIRQWQIRNSSATYESRPIGKASPGFGLEAQRKAVLDYLNGGNW